jgi:hypothetical protein
VIARSSVGEAMDDREHEEQAMQIHSRTFAAVVMVGLVAVLGTAGTAAADSNWAVVSFTGKLLRGKQVLSVAKFGSDGTFEVIFKRNVAKCAYVASVGDGGDGFPGVGFAIVAGRENNPNGVVVTTFDDQGARIPRSFHLKVFC